MGADYDGGKISKFFSESFNAILLLHQTHIASDFAMACGFRRGPSPEVAGNLKRFAALTMVCLLVIQSCES